MRSKVLVLILVAAGLIAGAGYLVTRFATVVVPERGGTYVEGVVGSPNYINPILSQYNQVDQDLVSLIFSGLTAADAQGVVVPDVAERWEISEDGLSYTFYLRRDVRWHDGAPLTAVDVAYTIQSIQDPNYQGPVELHNLWSSVRVEAPDEYTVVFTLPEPFAPFLEYTTQRIIPSHVLATVSPQELPTSQFNAQPIGAGPYKLTEITAQYATLEANTEYHGPQPHIARLRIMFYPDQPSLMAAEQRGEVAGLAQVLPENLADVQRSTRLNLYSAPYAGYAMIFLNHERPVFQDPVVRKALWQATDRQGLVDSDLDGQGLVLDGPILPSSWAYDPELPKIEHDPQAAAAALEAAGWVDPNQEGVRAKDGVRLEFTLLTNNDDPVRAKMIEDIAAQWAAIGVRVHTQTLGVTELVRDHLTQRNYDALLYGWDLPAADPDPYPLWHSSQIGAAGQNYVGYRDEASDQLLETARRSSDRAERTALYRDFQRRFVEQTPSILLYQPIYNYAVDKQVQGVQITPLLSTGDRFRTIDDWYMATTRVLFTDARAKAQ